MARRRAAAPRQARSRPARCAPIASARRRTAARCRNSGEPYITHSVEVAKILADLQLDSVTVAERAAPRRRRGHASSRSPTSRRSSGRRSPAIVDGLTKIAKLPTGGSTQERQVESYRKLLLSIAKDVRVIIVKLADRLHNMRTLDWLPPEKRVRIAQETRDLYAPLAHRFGMAKLRWELEDLVVQAHRVRRVQVAGEEGRAEARRARSADQADGRSARSRGWRSAGITRRRRHRAAEAPVVDLQEDEAAREAVRGDLRPPRHSRARQLRARLLPRARRHPRRVDAGAGAHQGLHRAAEVERLPVAAHDGVRSGTTAVRSADPHARHAPHGGLRHRGALALQGGREERRARSAPVVVPAGARAADGREDARRVPRVPQARLVSGRDLRLHADGRRHSAAEGRDAARLRVRRAHRDRAALRRREGERPHRAALARAAQLGDGRDHHVDDGQADARLARARPHRPRAPQDSPGPQARSADVGREARAGDARSRGQAPPPHEARRRSDARRRGDGARASPTRRICSRRSVRATSTSRSRSSISIPTSHETRAAEAERVRALRRSRHAARRAFASRASTGSWCATRSAASRCPAIRSSAT